MSRYIIIALGVALLLFAALSAILSNKLEDKSTKLTEAQNALASATTSISIRDKVDIKVNSVEKKQKARYEATQRTVENRTYFDSLRP